MKSIKISLGAAVSVFLLFSGSAFAAGPDIVGGTGSVNVAGVITAASCTAVLDKGALKFSDVSVTDVKALAAGSALGGGAQVATFNLTNCPVGTVQVGLAADAVVEGDARAGLLSIGGGKSKALHFIVSNESGDKMLLDGGTGEATNKFVIGDGEVIAKSIPLKFDLVGTGVADDHSVGDISAVVTYALTYE